MFQVQSAVLPICIVLHDVFKTHFDGGLYLELESAFTRHHLCGSFQNHFAGGLYLEFQTAFAADCTWSWIQRSRYSPPTIVLKIISQDD